MADDDVLFIFLDESGNFDFSPDGSSFWTLTALCTLRPIEGRDKLTTLCMNSAALRAADKSVFTQPKISRTVLRIKYLLALISLPRNFEIHSILAEKRKANPSIYCELVHERWKTDYQDQS